MERALSITISQRGAATGREHEVDDPDGPCCPITQAPPRCPVSLPDEPQVVYERDALARWLRRVPVSPVTRRQYWHRVDLVHRDLGERPFTVYLDPPRAPAARAAAALRVVAAAGGAGLLGAAILAVGLRCESECVAVAGGVLLGAALCVGHLGARLTECPQQGLLELGLEEAMEDNHFFAASFVPEVR